MMEDSPFSVLLPLYMVLLWGGWLQYKVLAEQECQEALGMETGAITDGQITASSQWDFSDAVTFGRLFNQSGGWVGQITDANQWMQIDLGEQQTKITRVATQGRFVNSYWVTQYKLQYSDDGSSFQYYREEEKNHDKTFNGNTDQNTVVYHDLNPPISARYIRFRPKSWNGHLSMRVELYGCLQSQEQAESTSPVTETHAGLCRSLKFATPVEGLTLEGHVVKNISLSVGMHAVTCRDQCVMEGTCASFNIGPPMNDKVVCQLSDSDHILHPDDLKLQEGFTYRGTAVNPCFSNPCHYNGTCLNGFTSKKYLCVCPAGAYGERCEKVTQSCKELYDKNLYTHVNKAYLLKMDSVVLSVYCHMTNDLGSCRGGGWTLVMKIDGNKQTFHYDSTYWSNKTGYNLTNGETGFDTHETKLPSYWNTSFTKICLGMKIGSQLVFIVMSKEASSLFSLIADGQYRPTSLGRNTWKALVGYRATLQLYCDYEGFNPICSHSLGAKARIGIVNNDNDLCNTCDSKLGFGTGGYIGSLSCGNVGPHSSDNGGKTTEAMCYIFIQ